VTRNRPLYASVIVRMVLATGGIMFSGCLLVRLCARVLVNSIFCKLFGEFRQVYNLGAFTGNDKLIRF